jgi:formylmethanofuran dehydrogenase subunit E
LMIIGGVVLITNAVRKQNQESPQNVVMKIDLPGDTKISQMKCQSCGGAITSNDVKMMAGAPVVTCPYCQATYQLTEEPKW